MTASREARNVTVIGRIAAALAYLSALYLRAISQQLGKIASATYKVYRRFEMFLVTAATDLVLFVWALRSFVLLLALEALLIMAATRWPIVWLFVVASVVLLFTAAVEVSRRRSVDAEEADTDDPLRNATHFVLLWILRVAIFFAGIAVSTLLLINRQEREHATSGKPPTRFCLRARIVRPRSISRITVATVTYMWW